LADDALAIVSGKSVASLAFRALNSSLACAANSGRIGLAVGNGVQGAVFRIDQSVAGHACSAFAGFEAEQCASN